MVKSGLHAFHDQAQATNRFYLGAVVLSDAVVDTIRRELRRLSDALNRAAGGQGAAIFLSGEPGIGKTRLAQESLELRAGSVVERAGG